MYDTRAVHGDKVVSFGGSYPEPGYRRPDMKVEFKNNCLKGEK